MFLESGSCFMYCSSIPPPFHIQSWHSHNETSPFTGHLVLYHIRVSFKLLARIGAIRVLVRIMFRLFPGFSHFLFNIFISLFWVLASLSLLSVLLATSLQPVWPVVYSDCVCILFTLTLNCSPKTVPTSKITPCHTPEDHSLNPDSHLRAVLWW